MFGYIKGYTTCTITNKLINQETLNELILVDNTITDKLSDAFRNNAYIVGMRKKKVLKCIYIFNRENDTLIFSQIIKTDEITDKVLKAFEKDITEDLKGKVYSKDISYVDWNDIVIEPDSSVNWLALGISLGVLFGIALDSMPLGLCCGVALGCSLSVIVKNK